MKCTLNTERLQRLCEAVVRHSNGYNEGATTEERDKSWQKLRYISLPALEEFFKEGDK